MFVNGWGEKKINYYPYAQALAQLGYLVALLSAKRKLKYLVLHVPADYPDELFESCVKQSAGSNPVVRQWRQRLKNFNESSALRALYNFGSDVLLIKILVGCFNKGSIPADPYPIIVD